MKKVMVVSPLCALALLGCSYGDLSEGENVYTEDNNWRVVELTRRPNEWAAFNANAFIITTPPSSFQVEGVSVIEQVSGCKVIPETVVTDRRQLAVYANVTC